jgi:hypothetical protein
MAKFNESSVFTEATLKNAFDVCKAQGDDFLIIADRVISLDTEIQENTIFRGVRAANAANDLRSIYNEGGQISLGTVIKIGDDFESSQRGGLELLPVADVIAVERERAVAEYKKSLQPKPDNRSFWERLGDFRPGL